MLTTLKNWFDLFPPRVLIADFFRYLRRPKEQGILWADYRRTKRDATFVRQHRVSGKAKGAVLVVSLGDWAYQLKIEAMLATGLRLDGWNTIFLLKSRSERVPRRYLKAYGFDKFVYWDDYLLDESEQKECERDAQQYLDERVTFQKVKNWRYRDCWIGPQILASVSRGIRDGSPDVNDPKVWARLNTLLPDTLATVRIAEKIIPSMNPELVFLLEPNYARNGAITDVAVNRGINFAQASHIARDDAYLLRRLTQETRREHPFAITKENFAKVKDMTWTDRHERELAAEFDARYGGVRFLQARNFQGDERPDKGQLMEQLGADPAKKNAVVFAHILWDANLFFGEDLFEDYGDWFVQTVRAAVANDRVNWLLKVHPANIWKRVREGSVEEELSEITLIRQHIGELPDHVHLILPNFKANNRALFDITDYAVTVRGTVSAELGCFGIPVFTAGTGRCDGMGFTVDSASTEEYLDRMAHIHEQSPLTAEQIRLAKIQAHSVFCRRPWQIKSFVTEFQPISPGYHPLDHNLHLNAKSVDEISRNGDLRRWAKWAMDTREIDYLEDLDQL